MVLSLLLSGTLILYVLNRIWVLFQVKVDRRFPRQYAFLMPVSLLGSLLPTTWWNLGLKFIWRDRERLVGNNSSFHKSDAAIDDLRLLGDNVVGSEGEVWRRHRRIVAPAFNHTTYQNVWSTTARVYESMIEKEGWTTAKEVRIVDANVITHKLALFVIFMVGFGVPMTWDMADRDEAGRLTVQGMAFRVSKSILMRSRTPNWVFKLGIKEFSECDEAYSIFNKFMVDRIASREDELRKLRSLEEGDGDISEGIKDVFGRLVNARLSDGKLALSDSEIIGNCFILVFAGHETTAYTLSATMALLAVFPEAQDWVYNSVKRVLGGREPTFYDFDALEDVLACFYEALRMFPAAYMMSRQASSDTILRLPRTDNQDIIEEVPIRKGTNVMLDFVGMGYDPQTFNDPESFQPWRWSKSKTLKAESTTTDKLASEVSSSAAATALEGFTGFSFGPRTCLGHKFAKIEAVAFLTPLIRDWRIEPDLRSGETAQEWRSRVLDPGFRMTLTLKSVPIKLVRRK